jgi:hypothetical protein
MESAIVDANRADDIVAPAASGDEVAFARLIDEYHEPMVRAAYVVVSDVELAREAAQNAWTIAWKRLGSLRDPIVAGGHLCQRAPTAHQAQQAAPDHRAQ